MSLGTTEDFLACWHGNVTKVTSLEDKMRLLTSVSLNLEKGGFLLSLGDRIERQNALADQCFTKSLSGRFSSITR